MSDIQKLREQRANIWEQMKALQNLAEAADRDFTGEEKASYEKMEADLDALGNRVERADRNEKLEASLSRVDRTGIIAPEGDEASEDDEHYTDAFNAFVRRGMNRISADQRMLMESRFSLDKDIQNAAAVGTGAAGGYTIPPAFRAIMVETMKAYGVMLSEAELITTDTGANLPWPTNDDTGNIGAWIGENTQAPEQDLNFNTNSLDAFMATSKIVRVSVQFLNDSPNADAFVARKLGERIGRLLSRDFTVGTGAAQPDGIMTSAGVAVTGAGSLATTGGITYDNLVDLQEALDPAYGDHPNCKWMMHQSVRKAVRKLKDAQGRPIWEPSVQVGSPDTLLGRAVRVNNDMAAMAQNSLSLGYGNIAGAYVARSVNGSASLLRLTERYADYLQVGFLAFERWDGTLQDPNAFKAFKSTATA